MEPGGLLTPAEIAATYRVSQRTVARWAREKKIRSIRTPGGQYRIPRAEIERVLAEEGDAA